jgi:hypothetical protein
MRLFENGEAVTVVVGPNKLTMIVIDATERLAGWKYRLAFPKKDGTPDKRREHRFYWENQITKS